MNGTLPTAPSGGEVLQLIGAASSRQRMRVYDKFKQSDGEVNAIRWELQSRDEAAESMLGQLVEAGGNWGEAARARLVGYIDFREEDSTEVELRTRCDWYEALMGDVERANSYSPKAERDFDEFFDWFRRTQATGLACIQKGLSMNGIEFLLDEGGKKMKPKHHRMVARAAGLAA